LGEDIQYLKSREFNVIGFDPYYHPKIPDGKFDTIICTYVLNVLLPEEQSHVLMAISELLNLGGKAFFAVRRDINKNGFRYNPYRKCNVYQCNVILNYESIFQTSNCELYEYQHFNFTKKDASNCIYCKLELDTEVITESAMFYAIYNNTPITKGHSLVIPKRHISNFFELKTKEQFGGIIIINRLKNILDKKYSPLGFNVEIKVGRVAGQMVEHSSIHVIPRYQSEKISTR
jgi:diadenosine tetraphosphate (Ap4A) HIT family hydrolase